MRYAELKKEMIKIGYKHIREENMCDIYMKETDNKDLVVLFFDKYSNMVAMPRDARNASHILENRDSINKLPGNKNKSFLYIVRKEDKNAAKRVAGNNIISSVSGFNGYYTSNISNDFSDIKCILKDLNLEDKMHQMKMDATGWDDTKIVAPYVTTLLVLVCVFLSWNFFKGSLGDYTISYDAVIRDGEYKRLFTALFGHANLIHLVGNMIALVFAGSYFEKRAGHIAVFVSFILGGLYGEFVSMYWSAMTGDPDGMVIGASGGITAILGGMLVAELLMPKGYRNLAGVIIPSIYMIASGFLFSNVDNASHIGGFLGGMFMMVIYRCLVNIRNTKKYNEASAELRTRRRDFATFGRIKL